MKPYNILYVHPTARVSGAEISLLNLLEKIDRSVFSPHVVISEDGDLSARLRELDVPVNIVKLEDGSRHAPWPFLRSVAKMAKVIISGGIDLVHVNFERCNRPVAFASKITSKPQICHVRNIQNEESVRHFYLKLSPYLIANSYATEASYAPFLLKSQKSFMVHNGVDLLRFMPQKKIEGFYGIEKDAIIIAQVGRIVRGKKIDNYVKAMSRVIKSSNKKVYGLIVGDISDCNNQCIFDTVYYEEIKKLIAQLGLDDRLIFTGFIKDQIKLFSNIDVLVQSSQVEGFGRTLIEAMAMGIPVIATKSGGAMEVIKDNSTGLLVSPDDINGFAQAIMKILLDNEFAGRLKKTGRERVENMFSIEEHVHKLEQIYTGILSAVPE
jgi:glycosyltransferase involved in cell wall biosynthesis